MRIDKLSAAEAVASLHSAPQGLSVAEALKRLREFGPNQVERVAGSPLWLRFFNEFVHFFAVILWLAAGLAFVGEWSAPGQGMAKVGFVVIAVIIVSGLFSFWQEYRAEQTLTALLKLLPQEVKAVRDGKATSLAVAQLVPGDIVLFKQVVELYRPFLEGAYCSSVRYTMPEVPCRSDPSCCWCWSPPWRFSQS